MKNYQTDDSLSIPVAQLLSSGVGGFWLVVAKVGKSAKKGAFFIVPSDAPFHGHSDSDHPIKTQAHINFD